MYFFGLMLVLGGVVYSSLAKTLFEKGNTTVPPFTYVLFVIAGAIPLIASAEVRQRVVRNPVLPWCALAALIWSIGILLGPLTDVTLEDFTIRLLQLTLICSVALLMTVPWARAQLLTILRVVLVVSVALNLYEVVRPGTFSYNFGRAAGLFGNPNVSAAAILLMMIFALEGPDPRRNAIWVGIAGLGIAPTLSRAGAFTWLVLLLLATYWGRVSLRRVAGILGSVSALTMVLLVALPAGREFLSAAVELAPVIQERLTVGADGELGSNRSLSTRLEAVRRAVQAANDHPLIGSGLRASTDWDFGTGTHNQYLRNLVESGILGAMLLPLLAGAMVLAGVRSGRREPWLAAVFLILWGFGSHNIFDERHFGIAVAILGSTVALPAPGDGAAA